MSNVIKSVAVFCGSKPGRCSTYMSAATRLGEVLASKGIALVYGGGSCGLMGAVAEATHKGGGRVTGIIPTDLGWNIPITYGDTINVRTINERKSLMCEKADAFITLPGGLGTMSELMEVVDLYQNKVHQKPVCILNTENYYDKLLAWVDHSVAEGFMYEGADLIVDSDPERLITKMLKR